VLSVVQLASRGDGTLRRPDQPRGRPVGVKVHVSQPLSLRHQARRREIDDHLSGRASTLHGRFLALWRGDRRSIVASRKSGLTARPSSPDRRPPPRVTTDLVMLVRPRG